MHLAYIVLLCVDYSDLPRLNTAPIKDLVYGGPFHPLGQYNSTVKCHGEIGQGAHRRKANLHKEGQRPKDQNQRQGPSRATTGSPCSTQHCIR